MNLANKITIFRIVLVPIFLLVLYSNIPNNTYMATAIFVIAAITDTLDGYIARHKNLITNFGKFFDPLADKILVSAALIYLVEVGKVPAWIVILIMSREFAITGFRVIAASEGITIAASPLGKFKTITQLIAIPLLLLDNWPFHKLNVPLDMILIYIALFFTVLSGIDYIYKNRAVFDVNDI
ncbi:MAG: CDP-diacylglycerol--glycerol-3-phosphate 3-phosphatidyltransferase [Tissierellia bacterium]|nr:CDP-diacylglycerol--glycerol-3-phosphate 3-phosphatidyltransferase [Tissierellia bacterium]